MTFSTSPERWRRAQAAEAAYHAKVGVDRGLIWSSVEKTIRSSSFGGRVLEVGCSPSGAIHDIQADSRVGIDPIEYPHECSVRHLKGLAERLPFPDGSFDTVLSLNALDHMASPSQALREIHRVLKPGGVFMLSVDVFPLPRALRDWLGSVDSPHPFHFSLDDVMRMLTATGFTVKVITTEKLPMRRVNNMKLFVARYPLGMRLVNLSCGS